MEGLIQLITMTIFGIVCALIANSRGRSGVGWFFIGFFLGCIGLIIVLVLPDLRVLEEREKRLRRENQRLKERLQMDRHVADRRHSDTVRRLEAHDQALGVDTSPSLEDTEHPEALAAPAEESGSLNDDFPPHDYESLSWYYVEAGEQVGPVDFNNLARLWVQGRINTITLVWQENMEDWMKISDMPGLEDRLSA